VTTVLKASPRRFVSTPSIERIATRALRYLQSGFSVHLRGPAGTGKTTLALHLADLLARPIMLMFGDDEFKTSDLIGNQMGYTRKKVVDNFIHSVVKVEDELRQNWVDSRLTLACKEGFTLVYDEFNRSRPEVNNVLLSALEEKLLALPPSHGRSEYVRVNPHFRAIFTSNPEEYCGVHATQDALLDRLVTINIPEPDELTQQEIVAQKTGIDRESALIIVRLIKAFRLRTESEKTSGLRSGLIVAKICHEHGIVATPENSDFRELCQDVLTSRAGLPFPEATRLLWEVFNEQICGTVEIPQFAIGSITEEIATPGITATEEFVIASDAVAVSPPEEIVTAEEISVSTVIGTEEAIAVEDFCDASKAAIVENLQDIYIYPEDSQLVEENEDKKNTIANKEMEAIAEPLVVGEEIEAIANSITTQDLTDDHLAIENEAIANMSEDAEEGIVEEDGGDSAIAEEQPELTVSTIDTANEAIDLYAAAASDSSPGGDLAGKAPEGFLVPYESEVYAYLQQHPNARYSEIESALHITRFQTVNAMQVLTQKGLTPANKSNHRSRREEKRA
jgi:gas vesicle protein GvpN